MSRIIQTDSPARNRERLLKTLASAYRYYKQEKRTEVQHKDLCAFALLTLRALCESIDRTASAWEKRDYWLKADRLRSEWKWTAKSYEEMQTALKANDVITALKCLDTLSDHFDSIALPKKTSDPNLWKGAWAKWKHH